MPFVPALLVASSMSCVLVEVDLPATLWNACSHGGAAITMRNAFSRYSSVNHSKRRKRGSSSSLSTTSSKKLTPWLTGIAYPYAADLGAAHPQDTAQAVIGSGGGRPMAAAPSSQQPAPQGNPTRPCRAAAASGGAARRASWADCIYGSEHSEHGVVTFDTYTLARHAAPFISSAAHLRGPEGITFAAGHMFLLMSEGKVACISPGAEILCQVQTGDPWVGWGLAAGPCTPCTQAQGAAARWRGPQPGQDPGGGPHLDVDRVPGSHVGMGQHAPAVQCMLYGACDMAYAARDYTLPPAQRRGCVMRFAATLSSPSPPAAPAPVAPEGHSQHHRGHARIDGVPAEQLPASGPSGQPAAPHAQPQPAAAGSAVVEMELQGSSAPADPQDPPRVAGSGVTQMWLQRPSGLCVARCACQDGDRPACTQCHGTRQQLWVTSMSDGLVCYAMPGAPRSWAGPTHGSAMTHDTHGGSPPLAPAAPAAAGAAPAAAQGSAHAGASQRAWQVVSRIPLEQILGDAAGMLGCSSALLDGMLPWDVAHLPRATAPHTGGMWAGAGMAAARTCAEGAAAACALAHDSQAGAACTELSGQAAGASEQQPRPGGAPGPDEPPVKGSQGWLLLTLHRSSGMPRRKQGVAGAPPVAAPTCMQASSAGSAAGGGATRSTSQAGAERAAGSAPHPAAGAPTAGAAMCISSMLGACGSSHLPLGGRGMAVALSLADGGRVVGLALLPKKLRHTNMACLS